MVAVVWMKKSRFSVLIFCMIWDVYMWSVIGSQSNNPTMCIFRSESMRWITIVWISFKMKVGSGAFDVVVTVMFSVV